MNALKKLVDHHPYTTGKPSHIELMVKEVHDKIEAEYKDDWEDYNRVQTAMHEAVTEAWDAKKEASIKLSVAEHYAGVPLF